MLADTSGRRIPTSRYPYLERSMGPPHRMSTPVMQLMYILHVVLVLLGQPAQICLRVCYVHMSDEYGCCLTPCALARLWRWSRRRAR